MAGTPSFEEAGGGPVEQRTESGAQRLGQMGLDRGGAEAGMPQQDLDEADIDPALEQVRGEAVARRVRPKAAVKAALVACLDEGGRCGGIGQVG